MTKLLRAQTFRARALRRHATAAERVLWQRLRNRQLGVKFRRQAPVGPYFADFLSEEIGLVVEADGSHHHPPPEHDRLRDEHLHTAGLVVLRIPNVEILHDTERALERIRLAIRVLLAPLPSGEGQSDPEGPMRG